MNRKIATAMSTVAASAVVMTGALAVAPGANAQAVSQDRARIHFSARTDAVLERAHVTTSPTGTARLTVSANEPSVLSLKVVRSNANRLATNGGVRFRTSDGDLAFGNWRLSTKNRTVSAVINKSARANFFRLKPALSGPKTKYQVVFNKLGAGQFNAILDTKTFHAGDIFGRVHIR